MSLPPPHLVLLGHELDELGNHSPMGEGRLVVTVEFGHVDEERDAQDLEWGFVFHLHSLTNTRTISELSHEEVLEVRWTLGLSEKRFDVGERPRIEKLVIILELGDERLLGRTVIATVFALLASARNLELRLPQPLGEERIQHRLIEIWDYYPTCEPGCLIVGQRNASF